LPHTNPKNLENEDLKENLEAAKQFKNAQILQHILENIEKNKNSDKSHKISQEAQFNENDKIFAKCSQIKFAGKSQIERNTSSPKKISWKNIKPQRKQAISAIKTRLLQKMLLMDKLKAYQNMSIVLSSRKKIVTINPPKCIL